MLKKKILGYVIVFSLSLNSAVIPGLGGLIPFDQMKQTRQAPLKAKMEQTRTVLKELDQKDFGLNRAPEAVGQANENVEINRPTKNQTSRGYTPRPVRSYQPVDPAFNREQLYMLARIIHAEAGGEPLKGQVAVGAVILNRIRSGRFPKTVSGNVFKRGEFESVMNGYIWTEPSSSAFKAAELALKGWDPSYGALYFFNPGKSSSRWIWTRPIILKIGDHIFAG